MHNQSSAERVVGEVRKKWFRVMFRKNERNVFWDYGIRWVCETISRTHTDLLDVNPDFREEFSPSIKTTRSKMLMKSPPLRSPTFSC
jgi:hypothetical protein